VDLRHRAEELLADAGRQPERRLVDGEELRVEHQRACRGEHLLLAAGHLAGDLLLALREHREELEAALEPPLGVGGAAGEVGAREQVLHHRQLLERAAALGAVDEPALADLVRLQALDPLAREADLPLEHDVAGRPALHTLLEPDEPRDGAQQRGLPRAVRADDADELALLHGERHAVQDDGLVVADVEVLHLKERHAQTPGTLR
jgi:hypothetical protein